MVEIFRPREIQPLDSPTQLKGDQPRKTSRQARASKHKEYACKKKKKGLCVKKRSYKDNLERAVTEFVVECLRNPVIVNKAVDDSIRFYEQRTGDDGLKSIEAHSERERRSRTTDERFCHSAKRFVARGH